MGGGESASTEKIDIKENYPVFVLSKNDAVGMLIGGSRGLESIRSKQRNTQINFPVFAPKKQLLRSNKSIKTDIYTIKKQRDGKILVGGNFGYVDGEIRNSIARINQDGSLDKKFLNAASGINGEVYDIKIAPNSDIVISGYFTNFNDSKSDAVVILKNNGIEFTTINILSDIYKLSVINDIEFLNNLLILSGLFVDKLENEVGIIVLNMKDLSINQKMTDAFKVVGQVFNTEIVNGLIYVVGNFKHEVNNNMMIFDSNGNLNERIYEFKDIDGFIFDIEIVDNLIYLVGDFTLNGQKNLFIINEKNEVVTSDYKDKSVIFDINIDTKYLNLATDDGFKKIAKHKDSK